MVAFPRPGTKAFRFALNDRLRRAFESFQHADSQQLAEQIREAYKRRKLKAIQDKWFRFEEGKRMACPLAALVLDCFPELPWKRWDDMKASDEARMLAVEYFGRDAVEGFENGMDAVGVDHARTEDYKRGFWLGRSVWAVIDLKSGSFPK